MKGVQLNKLHRYAGIVIAPFLVVQTLTGLLLNFGPLRQGFSTQAGAGSSARSTAPAMSRRTVAVWAAPAAAAGCARCAPTSAPARCIGILRATSGP